MVLIKKAGLTTILIILFVQTTTQCMFFDVWSTLSNLTGYRFKNTQKNSLQITDNSVQEIEKPETDNPGKKLFKFILQKGIIQNVSEKNWYTNNKPFLKDNSIDYAVNKIENIILPIQEYKAENIVTNNGINARPVENFIATKILEKNTKQDTSEDAQKNDDIDTNQNPAKQFTEEEIIIKKIVEYADECIAKNDDSNTNPKTENTGLAQITENVTREEQEHLLASFLKKHAPPQDLIPLLEKIIAQPNTKELSYNEYVVKDMKQYHLLKGIENINRPGEKCFFIKKGIDRFFNALCLKKFIKKNNLNSLDVAKKYIYCKNNNCLIIAQNIEEDTERLLDQDDIMQLLQVSLKTGFYDWNNCKNVITAKDGKIVFIDTEDDSFSPQRKCCSPFCVWNLTNKLVNSCPTKDDISLMYTFRGKVEECKDNYLKTNVSRSTADIRWSSEKFNYYKQYDLQYIDTALKQYQNKERDLPIAY